jgi:uncharacterized protein involved in exopolysaccharide biosynthesis
MGSFTSLGDVVSALFRRWWVIALACLIGFPISIWFALSQPRIYEATAVIQIEAPQITENLTGAATATLTADSQLDLIQGRMYARDNITAVLDKFALFPGLSEVERVGLLRDAVTINKLIDPALAWRPDVMPTGLSIVVRLGDPTEAAAVANEFLDLTLAEAARRTEGRAARTFEFFSVEEDRVRAEIAEVDAAMTRFKEENAASLPTAITAQLTTLARLQEQEMELENALIELEAEAGRLRAPDLARQTDLLNQQLAVLRQSISATQAAIDAGPEVERQLTVFERQLEQLQDEFVMITTRRSEAAINRQIEMQDQAERFEVLESAIVPEYPVSTSRKKLAIAGGIAAGFLGVIAALALEMVNGTIRTSAQMQRALGAQPVAVIPMLRSPGRTRKRRRAMLVALLLLIAGVIAAFWSRLPFAGAMPRALSTDV